MIFLRSTGRHPNQDKKQNDLWLLQRKIITVQLELYKVSFVINETMGHFSVRYLSFQN